MLKKVLSTCGQKYGLKVSISDLLAHVQRCGRCDLGVHTSFFFLTAIDLPDGKNLLQFMRYDLDSACSRHTLQTVF